MTTAMTKAQLDTPVPQYTTIDMTLFNMHGLHVRASPEYLGLMIVEVFCKVTDAVYSVGASNMGLAYLERIPCERGSGTLPTPRQIRAVLLNLMAHEVDECLRINGLQLINPHAEEQVNFAQK